MRISAAEAVAPNTVSHCPLARCLKPVAGHRGPSSVRSTYRQREATEEVNAAWSAARSGDGTGGPEPPRVTTSYTEPVRRTRRSYRYLPAKTPERDPRGEELASASSISYLATPDDKERTRPDQVAALRSMGPSRVATRT